jgi:hypothetical protein
MYRLEAIPIDLTKQLEIDKFVSSLKKDGRFELLNWKEFSDIIDFVPDLLVKFLDNIFLIQFIDKTVPEDLIFMLSVLSLSFKRKYEKKRQGEVIIVFFSRGKLKPEQINLIKLAERAFDMPGEIDVKSLKEIENSDIANFMEHEVWYKYVAHFKRAKEKGWL